MAVRELPGRAAARVVRIGALTDKGNVPDFSNRDPLYVDLSAPGAGILLTFPRAMTAKLPSCVDQGYSNCGPPEYRAGEGTSFAAPQVSATAGLLLALRPGLSPNQVAYLVERTADYDANAASGCRKCALLRDSLSGWGRLDVAKAIGALSGTLPPRDAYEANDDAGAQATTLFGGTRTIHAAIDYSDDDVDVYRVYVRRGERLYANLSGKTRADLNLLLWKPGTLHVYGLQVDLHFRVARSQQPGTGRASRLPHARDRLVLPRGQDRDAGLGRVHAFLRESAEAVAVTGSAGTVSGGTAPGAPGSSERVAWIVGSGRETRSGGTC